MADLIDPDELVDGEGVAELLGLSAARAVSVYMKRYDDFPKPFIERGRCRLWLAGDIEEWARRTDRLD